MKDAQPNLGYILDMPSRNWFSVSRLEDFCGRIFQNLISVPMVTVIRFWDILAKKGEPGSRKVVSGWYTLAAIRDNTPTTEDTFLNDANAQDATLMRLLDIGEQLSRIRDKFPDFYEQHHTDEWYKLIGLRNVISHGYREIDFEIIWDIVTDRLTEFTLDIKKLTKAQ